MMVSLDHVCSAEAGDLPIEVFTLHLDISQAIAGFTLANLAGCLLLSCTHVEICFPLGIVKDKMILRRVSS